MGHHTWAQTGFYVSRRETFLTFATRQRQTTAWPKLWHHNSLLFFEKAQIASNCRISYSVQAPLHFLHPQIRSFASLSSQTRFDSSNLRLSDVWWAQRQTRYVFSSLRVTLACCSVADPQRSGLWHLLWHGGDQRSAHELSLEGKSEFELKLWARHFWKSDELLNIKIFPLWSKMCVSVNDEQYGGRIKH